MEEDDRMDIAEVCSLFGISSRTLRFYEEKGIVESDRTGCSRRRKYNKSQLNRIQIIMVLRTLGLSVKTIQDYLAGKADLREIISLRRAEISALIHTKQREIRILTDALAAMEDGEDIFAPEKNSQREHDSAREQIARICSEYIIDGRLADLYTYFSRKMKDYMPMEVFQKIWSDALIGLGKFAGYGETEPDADNQNMIYQYLKFDKMTIRLAYVFHGKRIHGLWVQYCGKEQQS